MNATLFPEAAKRGAEKLIGWWPARRDRAGVAVFCYHSVHPASPFASVTPDEFEGHLQWFRARCDVVPLREVLAAARERRRRPVVAITFDDGFEDNHRYAFPLLRKFGMPATFFLSTGLLQSEPLVRERFGVLCEVPPGDVLPLSWEQVRAMRRGGMEIGAHSHTHPNLATLGAADAHAEIAVSKALIEEQLQEDVRSFAYPFGKPRVHISRETSELVREAAFELAVTIVYRRVSTSDDPLMIPRFAVNRDSPSTLAAKIAGRFDLFGQWQERGPRWWGRFLSNDRSRLLTPIPIAHDLRVHRDVHA